MKVVINYANSSYIQTQRYCSETAFKKGGADKVIEYGPENIDEDFKNTYSCILNCSRGGGYWLWKPYIIKKTIDLLNEGDYLFYVDSGSYFINSLDMIISCMEENDDDIISFAVPFKEKQWTKRAVLQYFNCDNKPEILESCQRLATFIFMRKTKRTVNIVDKYLEAATHDMLITDELYESVTERAEFIENRHDQSIFSLIAKTENIPLYRDPSEYGIQPELLSQSYENAEFLKPDICVSSYPQILVLHRKKKVNAYVKIMSYIRSKFPWQLYRIILLLQNKIKKNITRQV